MKKILLSVIFALATSHASQAQETATSSKYYPYYQAYSTAGYWTNVTQLSNPVTHAVTNVTCGTNPGLAILDPNGTQGPGLISESMGYAMINAALYNDKATFDRLSATVQAAIPWGATGANLSGQKTGLFPWFLSQTNGTSFFIAYNSSTGAYDGNSASDADINIALAYVYASEAANTYGWADYPTGSSISYVQLASTYIQNIRLMDFVSNSSASVANRHILTDGASQAAQGNIYNWHPDYSDIRAYQLFQMYDTNTTFWNDAITYTRQAWMALFAFGGCGTNDTRTTWTSQPTTGTDIQAASKNVFLGNATFGNLSFSTNYASVQASRWQTAYDSDSCRMPVRLMNYLNSAQNAGDSAMKGIANSALTALGSTYSASSYTSLTYQMNIWTNWDQLSAGYVQNFMACGLLDYAGNTNLPYANRANVLSAVNAAFGSNGLNGTISTNDVSPTSTAGYNGALTMWGLTESSGGETPLQLAVQSLGVSSDFTYVYTSTTEITLTSYTGNDTTDIDIPSTINGATVTRIADWAFWGTKVKVVYLPTTLKSIDFFAFAWSNVKDVYFSGTKPQVFGSPHSSGGLIQPNFYYNPTTTGWIGGVSGEGGTGGAGGNGGLFLGGAFTYNPTATPFMELTTGSSVPTIILQGNSSATSYFAKGLPAGLKFNGKTGVIYGAAGTLPSKVKAGIYDVVITETDGKSKKHPSFKLRIVIRKTAQELQSHQQALGIANPYPGTIYIYPTQ